MYIEQHVYINLITKPEYIYIYISLGRLEAYASILQKIHINKFFIKKTYFR